MRFTWEPLRGKWETAVLQLNQRLTSLRYVLQGVAKVEGFLLLEDKLLLRRAQTLMAQDSTPGTPEAGRLVLFSRLTAGGKMQLVVLYPSGAEHIVHTEP